MLTFTAAQFAVFENGARSRFLDRLAEHLAKLRPAAEADFPAIAARALEYGEANGLTFEIDIAAIAEVMLAVACGDIPPYSPGWFKEILVDAKPGKGQRFRECLAIELCLVPARA